MSEPAFTLSRTQVRELDRRAADAYGLPGLVLMENAGRGCAELLMRLNPARLPTVILCGPGNNGGDGFVIARHLDNHGWPVEIGYACVPKPGQRSVEVWAHLDWPSPIGLPADAEANYITAAKSRIERFPLLDSCHNSGIRDRLTATMIQRPCWIVDALFGTGLSRPLGPPFDEYVSLINAAGHPVLAVDIPSGLDCDTGGPLGPTVRATHTATFVAPKKGFANPASRPWTGTVHVVDIGAPRRLIDEFRTRQPV